jgi:hypothetical protein
MKPLAVALSGAGRESKDRGGGGDLSKVHCKAIWNCHNNEYILIKMKEKNEVCT